MDMYLCARDIDLSSFYTFSIDQARRENGHVFVCKRYRCYPLSAIFSIDLARRETDHVFVF